MKQMKKVVLASMIFAIMLITSIIFNGKEVEAATKLTANKWQTVTLGGGSSKDLTYTMPSGGYCYFQVQLLDYTYLGYDRDYNWYLPYSIVANSKSYAESKVEKSAGTWKSHVYSFKPKTTIHFNAISTSNSEYKWKFKIRVVQKNPKNYETESNNSNKSADTIKVNNSYSGTIMKDDADWFVFTAPKDGKYKVSGLAIPDNNTSSKTNIKMVTYKGSSKYSSDELTEGAGWSNVFKGKLKKGQKVYVKVAVADWYNVGYKLKVSTY